MPVFKYKTYEEAEKALWNFNPGEKYYDRVSELWDFANELSSISYPQGIFKFKSIEEANKHREEIEIAHAKYLHITKKQRCEEIKKRGKRMLFRLS